MLEGVQIIIARMESHPQDFIYDSHKLSIQPTPKFHYLVSLLDGVLSGDTKHTMLTHLTAEEKTALLVAYRKMMRQHFTAAVLARIFEAPEENEEVTLKYKTQGRYAAAQLGVLPPAQFGVAVAKPEGSAVQYVTSNNQI
jgi:hypothetical protein